MEANVIFTIKCEKNAIDKQKLNDRISLDKLNNLNNKYGAFIIKCLRAKIVL